ncbi:hypothetical protein [Saccharopolyspora sp. NPDC002376]
MSDLATITTDLAEWLDGLPLDVLPPVTNVSIRPSGLWVDEVEIQLGTTDDSLIAMAVWAEHLATDVSITRTSRFVQAKISAATRTARNVAVWTHFDLEDVGALTFHGVRLTAGCPIKVTAARLRQIAAWRAEQ